EAFVLNPAIGKFQHELSTKWVLNTVSTLAHVLLGKILQNHMLDLLLGQILQNHMLDLFIANYKFFGGHWLCCRWERERRPSNLDCRRRWFCSAGE
ncbi:Glucokinase regulatory protein, partial [Lemmus lemmus]